MNDVAAAFYIGSYQRCITLAQKINGDEATELARDSFVFRSFIAMGKYDLVIDERLDSRPIELQALQKLAVFMKAQSTKDDTARTGAAEKVAQWVTAGADNSTLLLVHGTMEYLIGNFEAALAGLQRAKRSFDCMALTVQILARLARIDLAREVLSVMLAVDDEAPIVQLTNVSVNLAMGGEYVKEAYYICEELSQKYAPTPLLLNAMAVSLIRQGEYQDAEALLQRVQEANPNQVDAIANMIVVAQMTGRAELAQRLRRQVTGQESTTLSAHFVAKANEFDRLCEEMAA